MFGIGRGFERWINPFFDDEGGGGGGIQNLPEVPSPSGDDVDALGGDEDEGDVDDEGESEEEGQAEEDKEEEEDDSEERDEDEEEVVEEKDEEKEDKEDKPEPEAEDAKRVPSIKALKEAYPDIFKKFPHVRTAIAEHQQFRAVYSSVDEAREAAEAQENFNTISDKIIDEGNFEFLFDEVHKADPAAAARLAKNILPTLLEKSRDLYLEVTEAPIKQFVHAAFSRAKRDGNKNLENASLHLWRFLGLDGNPTNVEVGPDPKDQEFQSRVREFEGRKHQEAQGTVNSSIIEGLRGLVEHAIDPKNSLKETTKKALVNELIRLVDNEVASDQNHMSRVNRLWANARRSSYAAGHTSRIVSAYLERAKQVLPKHARKVREENNISVEDKDDKKGERRPDTRRAAGPPARPATGGNPPRPRTIRDTNPRNIDWGRTSDEDVLSGRAVLRRR